MAFDILATGMVTAVGYNARASCAAMRARLDGFGDSAFLFDGKWLQAAQVDLPGAPSGEAKLVGMLDAVVRETLAQLPPGQAQDTVLALCLSERDRPGRAQGIEQHMEFALRESFDSTRVRFPAYVLNEGGLGGVKGLQLLDQELAGGNIKYGVLIGVDSYLVADSLRSYYEQRRLLTSSRADGFIPGEAAGSLIVGRPQPGTGAVRCFGIGWGVEDAPLDSGKPLRANGLTQAYKAALASAGFGFEQLDYRLTDISGEQYAFKEAALALSRCMRVRKESFELWHTADSIGRVGAASVPIALGVAWTAAQRNYAPGAGVICHFADEARGRAALVLRQHGKASNPAL